MNGRLCGARSLADLIIQKASAATFGLGSRPGAGFAFVHDLRRVGVRTVCACASGAAFAGQVEFPGRWSMFRSHKISERGQTQREWSARKSRGVSRGNSGTDSGDTAVVTRESVYQR